MSQTFCNTRVEPEEELLQCPYDPVHRILPKRMQTHLIKCRKAILGQPTSPYYQRALDMVVCKFNSKHHVQKNELDAHHFKCPDKKEFFSNVATITDTDNPEKVPGWMKLIDDSALKKQPNGDEEDWEDEWQQTYDPMEKINTNTDIIYNPQGLSKAKKRDYAFNRRLQAEGLIENNGQSKFGEEKSQNWEEDEWEINNAPSNCKPTAQKPITKSFDEWDDGEKGSQKQSNTNSKKHENKKNRNGSKNKPSLDNDGWTAVAPRFRKEKQKDEWDNATKDDGGWGDAPVTVKTNGFNGKLNGDDDWGMESSHSIITHNTYKKQEFNDQGWEDADTWGNDIPAAQSQSAYKAPISNGDDGGWDDGPSINPYLQAHVPCSQRLEEDEDGWEGEEYTPEPYIDEWGVVRAVKGVTDPNEIASKLLEKQQQLKEVNTDSWGGGGVEWTTVSIDAQTSPIDIKQGSSFNEKSKLKPNARNFSPPGLPLSGKLSRNAMEFTPPGFPSEENNKDDLPIVNYDPIILNEEKQHSSTPLLETDTDTLASGLTENDSDPDSSSVHPPPGFPQVQPSESGDSEDSNAASDDNQSEDEDQNTFSHDNSVTAQESKRGDVRFEKERKKVSMKVPPVQQNQNVHHRKPSRRRGDAGRKKKRENRNRSKSAEKAKLNIAKISASATNMAVKCMALSIVGALFFLLYLITVVVLLQISWS